MATALPEDRIFVLCCLALQTPIGKKLSAYLLVKIGEEVDEDS